MFTSASCSPLAGRAVRPIPVSANDRSLPAQRFGGQAPWDRLRSKADIRLAKLDAATPTFTGLRGKITNCLAGPTEFASADW